MKFTKKHKSLSLGKWLWQSNRSNSGTIFRFTTLFFGRISFIEMTKTIFLFTNFQKTTALFEKLNTKQNSKSYNYEAFMLLT